MATATKMKEPEMGLTFEKVWAALLKSGEEFDQRMQETDRRMQKSGEEFDRRMQETDRRMKEQMQETDRQIKETARQMKETDRQMKETDKKLGELGRKFGSVVEHMVAPNLVEKFNALGFNFTKYGPNLAISDKARNLALEVDVFLENGDCAVAVEVKAQLKIDDVKEHVERMKSLRRYADLHQDARKFYGAVAGAVIHEHVREYALKTGFYVISQSGDTMKIDVPEDFKPRAW
jgi:hypothetical protein